MATPQSGASPSSVSPGRRTRLQEKKELQDLNDRFVTYIGRVRRLRDPDSVIRTIQDSQETQASSVKRVYETELSEARSLIDETAKEKAHYQIVASKHSERLSELEAELKDSQDEVQKLRREVGDAHRRNDMLDKQLKTSTTEKLSAQQKVRELEEEVEELTAQLKSLRDSLEQETLSKVDLQNNIQSLKEKLAFDRRIHEEEVTSLRDRAYQLENLESTDYADDFTERLQAAIDEARDELERETELHRLDVERSYKNKLVMLEEQLARYSSTITNLNEQIREINSSYGSSKDALAKLQKTHEQLKQKLLMKDEQLTRQQQLHNEEIRQLTEQLQVLRESYEEKLREYEELLDLRVKLEQEILTLSALLSEEESRLNLPSTPREKRTRGHRDSSTIQQPHSKKTKRSQELSSSSSAVGSIQITDVDSEGRYIQIRNSSDKVEQLGNFKIVHEVEGTGEKTEFRFHTKSKLQGGASVTVWSTDAEGAVHHPPTDIIWKSCSMWGSGTKTVTSLCTKSGDAVATFTQRKESSSFTLEETDSAVRNFPSLPESPVPRHVQRRDPLPHVGDEHVFHQQGDPQGRDPGKCIVS